MAGTFFDYHPGSIKAHFSHEGEFDYIKLDMDIVCNTTVTTDCDDQFQLEQPVRHQEDDLSFNVYMSSVFCPFGDFIRFLEAITIEVQECAFEWDAEGPSGRMHWQRRYIDDTGFLTVDWNGRDGEFSHRVMFYTRQAVGALYGAFRSFVDGPDYDPIRYEELKTGQSFGLVVADGTLDDLSSRLIAFDSKRCNEIINRLREACSNKRASNSGSKHTIDEFCGDSWEENNIEWDAWIDDDWNHKNHAERMSVLSEIYEWGSMGWHGANLRALKSQRIEDWLAQPAPPLRTPFGIPKQI